MRVSRLQPEFSGAVSKIGAMIKQPRQNVSREQAKRPAKAMQDTYSARMRPPVDAMTMMVQGDSCGVASVSIEGSCY